LKTRRDRELGMRGFRAPGNGDRMAAMAGERGGDPIPVPLEGGHEILALPDPFFGPGARGRALRGRTVRPEELLGRAPVDLAEHALEENSIEENHGESIEEQREVSRMRRRFHGGWCW